MNSAAFRPDGIIVVTASSDGTARTWNSYTGTEINVFKGHDDKLFDAEFSRDGRSFITASADKTARIWYADAAREIEVLRGHDVGGGLPWRFSVIQRSPTS